MSKRYPGNFITGNPVALSQTSNNGIWDLKDNYQATSNDTWQEGDGIYEIGRSLRFRGSANQTLSRTPTVDGNRKKWTWSAWVKRGSLGGTHHLFSSPSQSGNDGVAAIYFQDNQLHTYYDSSGANPYGAVGPRLYRDPTAWMHIVWSVDAANTFHRVWVNNELVSTDTSYYPPNYDYAMNRSGYTHRMGSEAWGPTNYFDGYMAEVNFVDGQDLDPSYFGYTDSITGIWQPKRYTGTYGTNGFYILGNTTPETNFANYIGGGSSGNYLVAPYSADFALTNQDFTLEAFVYAGEAFSQNDHCIFNLGENVTSVNGKSLIFTGYLSGSTSPARSLRIALSSNGSSNDLVNYVEVGNIELYTWNHVAITRTGGYIYVNINGKRTYSYNIGSTSLYNQTTYGPSIAAYRNNGTFGAVSSWPGAISNVRFTIGQCLYTGTSFTVPTAPLTTTSQGATSSNVKLLCCQSSTAAVDNSQYARTLTNVGTASFVDHAMSLTDRSGNGNTWSFNNQLVLNLPGNRSTINWDIMVDSPTNVFTSATDIGGVVPGNYATLSNLVVQTSSSLTNGNLQWFNQSGVGTSYAKPASFWGPGKWYFEVTVTNGSATSVMDTGAIGVMVYDPATTYVSRSIGYGGSDFVWRYDGYKVNSAITSAYGTAVNSNNDVVMCAYDTSNNTVWFGKNGTWFASSNPATATSPAFTDAVRTDLEYLFKPIVHSTHGGGGTAVNVVNFGQRPFAHTPPAGFKSLCTTNLQERGASTVGSAAIAPYNYFDINLYGGTGASRNITNSGFQPDLVWIKHRSSGENHNLYDSARGPGLRLESNSADVETYYADRLTSFNNNGFGLGSGYNNTAGTSYVAWQWKQSPTAGFNVISYTGDGTNNRAISHNLGLKPAFIIVKDRTVGYNWDIFHKSLGISATMIFTNTSPGTRNVSAFGSTAPTASNFYTQNSYTNSSGSKMIAYLWAEVPGFSRFGSYTGSGSTDGTFVYTGFRPRFVMIKHTGSGTDAWIMVDAETQRYNVVGNFLQPSQIDQELNTVILDFLSNGFKLRQTYTTINTTNYNYIYMALAESPFGLNNRAR